MDTTLGRDAVLLLELNWLVLLPVYVGLLLALGVLWWLLAKVSKWAWVVVIALLPVVAIAPFWEELGIAYNFGQLCKKDAGIFVYETVDVEGYFDATSSASAGPVPKEAAESFERRGYQFYEKVLRDFKGGADKVVHFEKVNGAWQATVRDRPTARYHYRWPDSHTVVAHKIVRHERIVLDTETNELLGRDVEYGRDGPWFFIGLDRPVMLCPTNHPLAKHGSIYNQTLRPAGEK